uniref:Pentatricopeptide repeat-containing protein At4g38150-like n=1 Tax=Elaeis guineensis var. tenera TaxID=51953 RepID=A0A6I9QZS7_ELAGV|nr:pentatricopeptide repeat-containing protein At4g38150-like [Elaeis guineensis]
MTSKSPPIDIDDIFKKMEKMGLISKAVAILDGLCKDGLVQKAMKLFRLMHKKRTIPEVVIYMTVVVGFYKTAKFDDAKRIFKKDAEKWDILNTFSYAVLIQDLCKGEKLENSIEHSMKMLNTGHLLNAAIFADFEGIFRKKNSQRSF